jgi:hypothetical protein
MGGVWRGEERETISCPTSTAQGLQRSGLASLTEETPLWIIRFCKTLFAQSPFLNTEASGHIQHTTYNSTRHCLRIPQHFITNWRWFIPHYMTRNRYGSYWIISGTHFISQRSLPVVRKRFLGNPYWFLLNTVILGPQATCVFSITFFFKSYSPFWHSIVQPLSIKSRVCIKFRDWVCK